MMDLPGLRGDSFLGFLAALGVCRTLDAPLSWSRRANVWTARVETGLTKDEVIPRLLARCREVPAVFAGDPPVEPAFKLTINEWQAVAVKDPIWAAAIGSDIGDELFRSPLLMSSGGGHQHPLKMVVKLSAEIGADDIRGALFGPWLRHPQYGLRLDPVEYRAHADQWTDPSRESVRGEIIAWGPTRLAFEGFPLAPTLARHVHPLLDSDRHFAWPMWEAPLAPRAVTAKLLTAPPSFVAPRRHFSHSKGNWSIFPSRPA